MKPDLSFNIIKRCSWWIYHIYIAKLDYILLYLYTSIGELRASMIIEHDYQISITAKPVLNWRNPYYNKSVFILTNEWRHCNAIRIWKFIFKKLLS